MNAPTAIRIVAGTREFSLPWRRAATAPGNEATKFTATASTAIRAGSTRFFGM